MNSVIFFNFLILSIKNRRMKKTKQEWLKSTNQMIIFYKKNVLDITKLLSTHPGGDQAIRNYLNKDVTKTFFNVYPHPQSCQKKLLAYKIGEIIQNLSFSASSQEPEKKAPIRTTQNNKPKKVNFKQEKVGKNKKSKPNPSKSQRQETINKSKQNLIQQQNSKKEKFNTSNVDIYFSDQQEAQLQKNKQKAPKYPSKKAHSRRQSQSQFLVQTIDEQKPEICLRTTLTLKNAFNNP